MIARGPLRVSFEHRCRESVVRRIARWFGEQHRSRWSRHGACLKSALAEEPDFAARRAVVVGGEDASNTPCFMCHGLDGVGDAAGAFPLTGQAAFHMYKQLIDHAAEARLNDAMTPIARDTAADLSDDDIRAVALYFEWLRPGEDDGRGGARVSAHEPERNGG